MGNTINRLYFPFKYKNLPDLKNVQGRQQQAVPLKPAELQFVPFINILSVEYGAAFSVVGYRFCRM